MDTTTHQKKLAKSVTNVIGERCERAVVVLDRPDRAPVIAVGAAIVVIAAFALFGQLGLGVLVSIPAAALAIESTTRRLILGRVGDEIVFCDVGTWITLASNEVARRPAPLRIDVDNGIVFSSFDLEGKRYHVGNAYADGLRAITR